MAPADDAQRRRGGPALGAVHRVLGVRPGLADLLGALLVDGPVTPAGASQMGFRAASGPCGDGVPPGSKSWSRVDATQVHQPPTGPEPVRVRVRASTPRLVDMSTCGRPMVADSSLSCVFAGVGGSGTSAARSAGGVPVAATGGVSATHSGDVRDVCGGVSATTVGTTPVRVRPPPGSDDRRSAKCPIATRPPAINRRGAPPSPAGGGPGSSYRSASSCSSSRPPHRADVRLPGRGECRSSSGAIGGRGIVR